MLKKIISIMLAGILCFGLCACDESSEASVNDAVDQVANVVQAENENILAVKNATNSNYSGNITYEEAFEAFFADPTWKYFKGTEEGPDDDNDGEPDYTKDNIDVVEFTGKCTYQDVKVKALIQFTLDKDAGTFQASYLSFNEVPQSTLILAGLLEKVFESYQDKQQDTKVDNNKETEKSNKKSSKEKNITDEYNYEALTYAGSYEGYSGYRISFCAYSSVESDEIGVVEIYKDGELESKQSVYLCDDSGNWDSSEYDAFYELRMDGYNNYLGFYKSDGKIMLEYDGDSHELDTLEMKEHYES